jgi:hypothetical protein
MAVANDEILSQNGTNLARVLHTLHNANRKRFYEIERFIQEALPDFGTLQTPLLPGTSDTEIGVLSQGGEVPIRLHDLGGGIEQLLMVGMVLKTTNDHHPIFWEEPESHLHAGAQRYLIERLYHGNRQVFVTTHSPTFINISRPCCLHHITMKAGRTKATRVEAGRAIGNALTDIGVQNSDVLLSDAVVFVEGQGDKAVMEIWCEKLGANLADLNVTVIAMTGSPTIGTARLTSDLLSGISKNAGVPHLFLLDRDERSEDEIRKIKTALEGTVVFLKRRELENYFFVPKAIKTAIRQKLFSGSKPTEAIDAVGDDEIMAKIRQTAKHLYRLVLVKRVRSRVPALKGGVFPRELADVLSIIVSTTGLAQRIKRELQKRFKSHLSKIKLGEIVRTETKALNKLWKSEDMQLALAPGDEIVSRLFRDFGTEYSKPVDTVRIARSMEPKDIAPEIVEIVAKLKQLPRRE